MASSLVRCLRVSRHLSVSRACNASVRSFVTSSPIFQPRGARIVQELEEEEEGLRTRSVLEDDMDELVEQWDETSEVEDSPSGGHIILQEYRQTLHYLRLIEHEMPKLVGVFLMIFFLQKVELKIFSKSVPKTLYTTIFVDASYRAVYALPG